MRGFAEARVFVISLERALDRRAHIAALASRTGLKAEFVTAVDGRALTPEQRSRYNPKRAKRIYGCEMSDNEIACYLSHVSVYERMVRENIEVALILEDDISCVADFPKIVSDLCAMPCDSWQVIRLQTSKRSVATGDRKRTRGEAVASVGARKVCRVRTSVLGGCAYLIRRSAAEAMLERSAHIDMPVDQTLDRYWETGIVPYVLRPMPVWHDELFCSEIGDRGRTIAPPSPTLTLFGRRAQRLVDSFNKRVFWASFRVPSFGAVLAHAGVPSARTALKALWA
jgi:glycosyl transferase family 25